MGIGYYDDQRRGTLADTRMGLNDNCSIMAAPRGEGGGGRRIRPELKSLTLLYFFLLNGIVLREFGAGIGGRGGLECPEPHWILRSNQDYESYVGEIGAFKY